MDLNASEEVQISYLNSILQKVNCTEETFSETFVKSPDYIKLLSQFGNSKSRKIISLSLLILTKLLEKNQIKKELKEVTKKQIVNWISESTKQQEKLNGIKALSAIFNIGGNEIGKNCLEKDDEEGGILVDLMEFAEFDKEEVQESIIEMLSIACSQEQCRKLVKLNCQEYLSKLMKSKNIKIKSLAAVTLTKLMLDDKLVLPGEGNQEKKKIVSEDDEIELAGLLQNLVLNEGSEIDVRVNAIEGLAYASLKPTVKEMIAHHPILLKEIFKLVKEQEKLNNNNLLYGVAVILSNITSYKKKFSKNERQLLKLKNLADGEKSFETNPLDEDEYVGNRINQIMKLGVNQTLNLLSKSQSRVIRQLVSNIFLNLATDQTNRGMIVQQGGVKVLMYLAIKEGNTKEGLIFATQALAKIAITMDPNLAFRGERSSDLVRPLLNLCQEENELCQFESLMALTNLSSVDNDIRMRIYDLKGISIIENLQFSENTLVRRAATECLCNMVFCEPVYELYSDPQSSINKITVLVALSDVDDFETRRAASGALAILSTNPNVCKMILDRPKGIQILKDLFNENSPEIQHRAIECFKNIANIDKDKAELLVKADLHKRMLELIKESKVESVVVTCAETLKIFANHGLLKI
ncbi:armadillo-type protein [Glomus cerebriforme]|uniref:Armadillo-type protein n=1 Tax=Glomus cerebriforme TaxID=658196 RepID=A0A397S1G7_9GLOM|nr:armadillo-type protein [Glomus cerebriforme]